MRPITCGLMSLAVLACVSASSGQSKKLATRAQGADGRLIAEVTLYTDQKIVPLVGGTSVIIRVRNTSGANVRVWCPALKAKVPAGWQPPKSLAITTPILDDGETLGVILYVAAGNEGEQLKPLQPTIGVTTYHPQEVAAGSELLQAITLPRGTVERAGTYKLYAVVRRDPETVVSSSGVEVRWGE